MRKLLAALMFITVNAFAAPAIPVPGSVNPNVTQENIQNTICAPGWTKTIRPSTSYTNRLKQQQMIQFGITGDPGEYEEDHLISLELGGAPRDPINLWPQPWAGEMGARKKDVVETTMHRLVCAGTLSLSQAQKEIATDWEAAYIKYVTNKEVK